MPRIQAFEFNDLPLAPRWLRESIVEILGLGLRWGGIYVPVAPLFARFVERAGAQTVLDLASGSGEPCAILIDALRRHGIEPPRFVVSDLFPNEAALRSVAERYPGKVDVIATSVDATSVPNEVDQPARTIITAFHHLDGALARSVLGDCVKKKRAIFIVEAFPRSYRRLLAVMPAMILATLANPFLAKRQKLVKLFFTFVVPVIPLCGLWDAFVSVLRIHSEADLRAMVAGMEGGYAWSYEEAPFFPLGRATVFSGVPTS